MKDSTSIIILHPCLEEEENKTKPKKEFYWKPSKLVLNKEYQSAFDSTKEASSLRVNHCQGNLSTSSGNAINFKQLTQSHQYKISIPKNLYPVSIYNINNAYHISDFESDNENNANKKAIIVKTNQQKIKEEKNGNKEGDDSSDPIDDSDDESDNIDDSDSNYSQDERKTNTIKKKTKEKSNEAAKGNTKVKAVKKTKKNQRHKESLPKIKSQLSKTTPKDNNSYIPHQKKQEIIIDNKPVSTFNQSTINITLPTKPKRKEPNCNCSCLIV